MTSSICTNQSSIYQERIEIHLQLFPLGMYSSRLSIRQLHVWQHSWQTCDTVSQFCHKDLQHIDLSNYAW